MIIRGSIDEMMRAFNAKENATQTQLTAPSALERITTTTTSTIRSENQKQRKIQQAHILDDATELKELNIILFTNIRFYPKKFSRLNNDLNFFNIISSLPLLIDSTDAESMATAEFCVEELVLNLSLATPVLNPNSPEDQQDLVINIKQFMRNILNKLSPESLTELKLSIEKKDIEMIQAYWNLKCNMPKHHTHTKNKISDLVSFIEEIISVKSKSSDPSELDYLIGYIKIKDRKNITSLFKTSSEQILTELLKLPIALNNEKISISEIVTHLMFLNGSGFLFMSKVVIQILSQLEPEHLNTVVNEVTSHFKDTTSLTKFVNNSNIKYVDAFQTRNFNIKMRTDRFSKIIRQINHRRTNRHADESVTLPAAVGNTTEELHATGIVTQSDPTIQTTKQTASKAPSINDPVQLNDYILTQSRIGISNLKLSNMSKDFFNKLKKLPVRIKSRKPSKMAEVPFCIEELVLNLSLILPILKPNTSTRQNQLIETIKLLRKVILKKLSLKKLKKLRSSLADKNNATIEAYWNLKPSKRRSIPQEIIGIKVADLISQIKELIEEKTLLLSTTTAEQTATMMYADHANESAALIDTTLLDQIDHSVSCTDESDAVLLALEEFAANVPATESNPVLETESPAIDDYATESDAVLLALEEIEAIESTTPHRTPLKSVRTRRNSQSSTSAMLQTFSTDGAPMSYQPQEISQLTAYPLQQMDVGTALSQPEICCTPTIYYPEAIEEYGLFAMKMPPEQTAMQSSDDYDTQLNMGLLNA